MPKVSAAYREARRQQILEAAVVCFSREGFHRTTMPDIVAESALSPGAIYNYFEGKEEIITAIADDRHSRERTLIARAREESTVLGAFRRIRDGFFAPLKDPRERRRRRVSIQLWAEAQRNPRILTLVRRGVDEPRRLLATLIAEGQRRHEIAADLDPEATARFMMAVFHGFVLQLEWDARTPVEPYVALLDICMARLFADQAADAVPLPPVRQKRRPRA
jgi:AcrR family transcriptional regulator